MCMYVGNTPGVRTPREEALVDRRLILLDHIEVLSRIDRSAKRCQY